MDTGTRWTIAGVLSAVGVPLIGFGFMILRPGPAIFLWIVGAIVTIGSLWYGAWGDAKPKTRHRVSDEPLGYQDYWDRAAKAGKRYRRTLQVLTDQSQKAAFNLAPKLRCPAWIS